MTSTHLHHWRKAWILAGKAGGILGALALTVPLGFLFIGIPGFMLPTTATDPGERLEYGFWFVQWMSIPFLLAAVWLTAIGIVFRRGKVYWGTAGAAWLLSAGVVVLGFAILRDVAGVGAALIGIEPLPIVDSPPVILRGGS